jgi:hypothetical protein
MEISTRVFIITDPKKRDSYSKLVPEKLICCSGGCFNDNLLKILNYQKLLKSQGNLSLITIVVDRDQMMDLMLVRSIYKKLKMQQWSVLLHEIAITVYTKQCISFRLPENVDVM